MILDPDWLEARFKFDQAARAPRLWQALSRHFTASDTIRVIDVGAGTGANLRHCVEGLPGNQRWTLLDPDPALLAQGRERLEHWATGVGWRPAAVSGGLRLERAGRVVEIAFVSARLDDLPRLFDLESIDLVTANALFDLLPLPQFEAFARLLARYRIACYTTLNYRSMSLMPADAADSAYIGLYEGHMRRSRPAGPAMGATCGCAMARIATKLGAGVQTARSTWHIGTGDLSMLTYLLDFMGEAVGELLATERQRREFQRWLASRLAMARAGQLQMTVDHDDLWLRF